MTPVPLELPLRPAEAAELGTWIFEQAERRPLTDELRNRIAARAAVMRLESFRPRLLSLARDPVHPSSYYFAADAGDAPLLLHVAPATAPTSSVFAKPLLIGRMRHSGGPELIINSIPFGPGDEENIEKFATQIDTAFFPRPQGSRPAIAVESNLPAAFEAFRMILKKTGRNLAAVGVTAGAAPRRSYYGAVWAAIRSGWREGYTAGIEIPGERMEDARQTVREAPGFSRFAVDVATLGERALETAAQIHEFIREARSTRKLSRAFDFEVALGPVDSQEAADALDWLKDQGRAPQLLAAGLDHLDELAEMARRRQCQLSITGSRGHTPEILQAIGRATLGRFHYQATGWSPDLPELAQALLA